MNITVPKGFLETDEEEFHLLLANFNWRRVGFCNGENYLMKYTPAGNEIFAGCRVDGRFYVNPDVFKRSI